MPNNRLGEFIERLKKMEDKLEDHLIESGVIKTHLKVNTWLTGVILIALLAKFVAEWFRH
jgi:hypothetical protein